MPRLAYSITTSRTASIALPVRLRRAGRVAQVFAGMLILAIAYLIGRSHALLLLSGTRTSGTIVALKQEQIRSLRSASFYRTAYLPIVEYRVAGRIVRFEDWLGRGNQTVGSTVPILYDAANPSVAMIDRPVWNWFPWGPTALVGVLVLVSGTIGLVRLKRAGQ
jgi:Protein of unknown function (DUF3592)